MDRKIEIAVYIGILIIIGCMAVVSDSWIGALIGGVVGIIGGPLGIIIGMVLGVLINFFLMVPFR